MRFVVAFGLALVLSSGCGSSEPPAETTPEAPAKAPAKPGGPKKGAPKKGGKAKAPAQERVAVKLTFVDEAKYAEGAADPLVTVDRKVVTDNVPRNALFQLFKGPRPKEKERGLAFVASGAEGFEKLEIADGVAHVTLKGGCEGGGATLTVYDLIVTTLKQFDEVEHVKVYSPEGQTAAPTGASDSRPECLEP